MKRRAHKAPRIARREAAKLLKASVHAEKRFERALVRVMDGVHAGVRKHLGSRLESPEPDHRHDADRLMSQLFVYVRQHTTTPFDRMAATVNEANGESLSLLGISPKIVPGLQGLLAQGREELVRRVQEAARKYTDDLAETLRDPDNADLRAEELAKLIRDRSDVSLSEARFIARDTTLKTNAAVTQTRQRAAGVTAYTWSTSRDERVRPGHAALEGERCSYDDPPVTDEETGETNNPGEDWQCRCVPIPVIPELEEDVPEEGEETAA